MGLFLVFEGTIAIGLMSVVLTVGLLGVGALGWYVVRCDRQNRIGELDLLAAEGGGAVGPTTPHESQVHLAEPELETPRLAAELPVNPEAGGSPAETPPRRPRKGH